MRVLGLPTTSAGAIRTVRRHAERLELDTVHFRGKRRWSDDQLRQAVAECRSWAELSERLGLTADGGIAQPHIKGHAIRLGLDIGHLNMVKQGSHQPAESVSQVMDLPADRRHLRFAAPVTAAAWFMLRGCAVSFPAEPTVYDMLADTPQGLMRVQVKTTTRARKDGWEVGVGHHPDTHSKKGRRLAYDPDEIDLFFIVDGDMTMYVIPSRALAGRVSVTLRTYRKYAVGNARGLFGAVPAEEGAAAQVPA